MGLVPTLIADGLVMFESNAITRYLCENMARFAVIQRCPRTRDRRRLDGLETDRD